MRAAGFPCPECGCVDADLRGFVDGINKRGAFKDVMLTCMSCECLFDARASFVPNERLPKE